MILTVNIGNTHITVGAARPTTLPLCGRLRLTRPPPSTNTPSDYVDAFAARRIPGSDRGRHSGQCGAGAERPGAGGLAHPVQCAHPDRGAGAEEWHQAAAGQSCPTGCRTAVRCRCRSGRECRAAGGHFGRHGHFHDGGQRKAGAGGRRDPAPGPQLSLETLVKNTAHCPIDLAAGTPASILGKSTSACLQNGFVLGTAGRWTVWPRGSAPSLARRLPFTPPATCPVPSGTPAHPHPLPRDSDHRWPVPHLAEKPQRIKWIAYPAAQGRAVRILLSHKKRKARHNVHWLFSLVQ